VQLDRRLGSAEMRLGEERKAQIDRRRIQGVYPQFVEIGAEALAGIKALGLAVFVDAGAGPPLGSAFGVEKRGRLHTRDIAMVLFF
jgi:hypothetical protein